MRLLDIDKLIEISNKEIQYYTEKIHEVYAEGHSLTNKDIKRLDTLYELRTKEIDLITALEAGYDVYGVKNQNETD